MNHHTSAERTLLDSFNALGGQRIIRFKGDRPQLPRDEAETFARLLRSGHIRRYASGDCGWVSYQLSEPNENGATDLPAPPSSDIK